MRERPLLYGPNDEPLELEEIVDAAAERCPHERVIEAATGLRWCRDCKTELPTKQRLRR